MNIKGPKGPGGPAAPSDIAPSSGSKAEGAKFKEALDTKATGSQASSASGGVEHVIRTLSEQVRAGKTSPAEARQMLVAEVAKSMGPMPDEMRSRLESFLSSQLGADPGLAKHAAILFDNEGT